MRLRSKLAILAAATVGFAAMPASAAVQVTGYTYSPPAIGGGIGLTSAGVADYGAAGRFLSSIEDLASGSQYQMYTFCLDALKGYFTYQAYSDVALTSVILNGGRQSMIAGLLSQANSVIDGGASEADRSLNAAAIGLAIWEATHETGSTLSLTGGDFFAYGDFGAAAALANTFISNVLNGVWTGNVGNVRVLASNTGQSQNQVYYVPGTPQSPVPEPSTWALLLSGFAMVGAALRRRAAPVLARAKA